MVAAVSQRPGSASGVSTSVPAPVPEETDHAWRPEGSFEPLGMSLVPREGVGNATLFVLDAQKPVRVWRLDVEGGAINPSGVPAIPWFPGGDPAADPLRGANDLQAAGPPAFVTRFDGMGALPGRSAGWPGIVRIGPDGALARFQDGLRGANGIVDLGADARLLVSDYWSRRLRFVSKDPDAPGSGLRRRSAADSPDNLTAAGGRQRAPSRARRAPHEGIAGAAAGALW